MTDPKQDKLLDNTRASETLKKLGEKPKKGVTQIEGLMEDLHENGILLGMILFAVPLAIPLPYPPGFSTIFGAPLVILSIQMLFGSRKVKLPNAINKYEIKNTILHMISKKTVPIIKTIEVYIKPRLSFAQSIFCEQLVGFLCLIAALAVIVPLPFTNAIPSQGITIMTLGLLNRDGLVIIIGSIVAIIGIFIATMAIIGSWYLISMLFHTIF